MSVSRYATTYVATMASAGTLTPAVDISGSWGNVYLEIPSMTSNTQVHIKAAATSDGTYRRLKHPSLNDTTVVTTDFAIASAATNCIVPIPNGLKYLKVETTATVDDGCVFRVFVGD